MSSPIIVWNTPAGLIGNIQSTQPFNFQLSANTQNIVSTYSIISGSLPPGLSLAGVTTPSAVQGLIYGTPTGVNHETTSTFTVRIQSGQTIADRTFSIMVFGAQPVDPALAGQAANTFIDLDTQNSIDLLTESNVNIWVEEYSPSNLGTFPDGTYIQTYITANNFNLPPGPVNYTIVSGNLPANLMLDSATGNITGYVNPEILTGPYGWDIEPFDDTAFDYSFGNVSADFEFDVRISTQGLPITATYDFIIERSDFFNNPNANLQAINYHSPIFVDATHYFSPNGNTYNNANIILNTTSSDANFIALMDVVDFENDEVAFQIVCGNAAPYITPSNIQINGNTGWLTGYIAEGQSSSTPYQFSVRAFKRWSENAAYIGNTYIQLTNNTYANLLSGNIGLTSIFNNPYQTLMPISLQVSDLNAQYIEWLSNSNLGNIVVGAPSTLRITSQVSEPFITTIGYGATANAYGKLVSANLAFGGVGYLVNDILYANGGISGNSATIIVTQTGNSGQITETRLGNILNQEYSTLPLLTFNNVSGGSGNNAQFNLSFGIESVSVTNFGQFYPGALIGFSSEGEIVPATAHALILNGSIANIVVDNSGTNYQNIPDVYINSYTTVSNANPVIYSITNGTLPLGLELLSNGMIVGRPSYQAISNNNYSSSFTVKASVGTNYPRYVSVANIANSNTSTVVLQEFQELTFSTQNFTINLDANSGPVPKTNLSLEFLLNPADTYRLQNMVGNVILVPNQFVYRADDFYFGRCQNYRMLVAYGVNPAVDGRMIAAIAKYHTDKNYLFTGLGWAQSIGPDGTVDYEVVYITLRDDFTTNGGNTFTGSIQGRPTTHPITVDTNQFTADDIIRDADNISMAELYPATLPNMTQQLKNTVSDFAWELLPTWMTSVQPNGQILGYTQAIPLVYCNPGTGQLVMYNLNNYLSIPGNGLNNIKAVTDRYIWDESLAINWDTANNTWISGQVDGFTQLDQGSQYLKFRYRNFMATPNPPCGAGY